VHSSAKGLRLITFDADGTLYADGCHIEHDNEMVSTHMKPALLPGLHLFCSF
jgi:IMP and pyridine-specific 5'-nucleotidase